ncbi:MAG: MlaD family protein [Bacteroidota bacterium]
MKREIKVGLTLLAGLVLAYLVVAWVNRTSLFAPPEKQYFLSFQQVNGLLEGDPVVVRGYQAGRVVAIIPEANAVSVEVALDERIALFADGYAEIQIKELMGGKQISLITGAQGNPLASGASLKGRTSLDFSTAFSRFGGVMDQMDPENIERLAQRFDSVATAWNAASNRFRDDKNPHTQPRYLVNRSSSILQKGLIDLAPVQFFGFSLKTEALRLFSFCPFCVAAFWV